MKIFLALAAFTISINVNAFTQKAALDFTNLYGKTNAGLYEMSATFTPKTTKSISGLTYSTHRDDNDLFCVTTAKFEIGKMLFTLTDVKTGWTFTTARTISASISIQSEDETCETNVAKFSGNQSLYATLGLNEAILLPVKAPFDYEKVATYLSPFNGYLYLNADLQTVDGQLVIDPSQMLTEKSIQSTNKQNSSVTYYVFASKESTQLSLGNGLIKF